MSQADRPITSANHPAQGADARRSYLDTCISASWDGLEDCRVKLGSFRDLVLTLADERDGTFYALTNYLEWLDRDLAAVSDMLARRCHLPAVQPYQPVIVPKDQAGQFAAALGEFQNANTAYALATSEAKEEDAPRCVWHQLRDARDALLSATPTNIDQARQLLSVCLADLAQDLTVGGPLPDAVLGAMGTALRALEQPDPAADPAVIAAAEYQRLRDLINNKPDSRDVTDEESVACHAAWLAARNATPTTPAGVAAKLRASLAFYEASEIDDDALSIPLADLERLAGKAVLS